MFYTQIKCQSHILPHEYTLHMHNEHNKKNAGVQSSINSNEAPSKPTTTIDPICYIN